MFHLNDSSIYDYVNDCSPEHLISKKDLKQMHHVINGESKIHIISELRLFYTHCKFETSMFCVFFPLSSPLDTLDLILCMPMV